MKKKILVATLLIAVLSLASACSTKDKKKDANTASNPTPTAVATVEPLPTAEVTENKLEDGTIDLSNQTNGYQVNYDPSVFKLTNENSTLSFQLEGAENATNTDEKKKQDKDVNLNVFVSVITSKTPAKAYNKDLAKAYKKKAKKAKTTIGKKEQEATCFTISDIKGTAHQIYVVDGKDKTWVIETKYPVKSKKYKTAVTHIVTSLTFEE